MNKSPPMIFQPEQKPVNEQKAEIFILQPCYSPMRLLCVRAIRQPKILLFVNC
jgi:hypothetical protein